MNATARCAGCGGAGLLAEPHVTLNRHRECHWDGVVEVLHAETLATIHLACECPVIDDSPWGDSPMARSVIHTYPLWITDHAAAVQELGALAWLLQQVVALADDTNADEATLRRDLRTSADRARGKASVQRRTPRGRR